MLNPCLAIILSIAILLVLISRKTPLWIVFVIIATITPLLTGNYSVFPTIFYNLITSSSTWDLVIVMYLVAIFVTLYRVTGFVDKLSNELVGFLRKPRLIAMLVPAILGLLPVPGGALMSAPVVDNIGNHLGINRVRRVFVNVWFRHVIFLVYPLSTVLIMTSILTGVSLSSIILLQLPIALIMVLIGYLLGFPLRSGSEYSINKEGDKKALIVLFLPILATIAIALGTSNLLDYKLPIPIGRISMILGVSTGIVLLVLLSGTDSRSLAKTLYMREPVELSVIGFTAMYLRESFKTLDFTCITNYLPLLNPIALLVIIPLFFSLIAGLVSSSIALSISILGNLVEFNPVHASLLYISAFLGYLGSPLHLCYVYTAKYMGVELIRGYKYLAPAIVLTLLLALVLYTLI
ncbi:MAG: DUF401 family protein [Thermoprotei archaeon]